MKDAKQIVYRYDGNRHDEEVVNDMDGLTTLPMRGSIIERKGKRWQVVAVHEEIRREQIPICRVFLGRLRDENPR
jgi:hypothetical protein